MFLLSIFVLLLLLVNDKRHAQMLEIPFVTLPAQHLYLKAAMPLLNLVHF
jgi:hypothetical protein